MHPPNNDPLWYKDAIVYELHVRAFIDSNADGMGDFRGLAQRLDYLQDLGVTARSADDAFRDTVRWLRRAGHISAREAGNAGE